MKFMEKKSSLHFSGRKLSKQGLTATVIGGIGWLIFAALSMYSAGQDGNGAFFIGVIGLLDAVFALAGVVLSYRGLHERDVYYTLPIIGMILNGTLFVLYFALYFMGVAIS